MRSILTPVGLGLLACLLTGVAHAQTDFQPGYIVPPAGDTLRGEVDFRDARLSAQRCRFRPLGGGEATTYEPTQLRAYGLPAAGKHFRSRAIPAGATPLPVGASYFLEVLIDGPAQLYFLRDEQRNEHFYVATPAIALTELAHGTRRVERDGRSYLEEIAPFRQVLAQALPNCLAAQSKLPGLPYSETSLRHVVTLYNTCQGTNAARATAHAALVHIRVGVAGGVRQSRLKFDGGPLEGRPLPPCTGPTGGLTFALTLPPVSRKISLELGALYEQQKYDLEYLAPYVGGISTDQLTYVHFDLAYLRLPLLLRYTYPRGAVRPLVEAGVVMGYALKSDNSILSPDHLGSYLQPRPLIADENFTRVETGLSAGLGLSASCLGGRQAALSVRAETGNGVIHTAGISSSVLRFSGLLSIDLTK